MNFLKARLHAFSEVYGLARQQILILGVTCIGICALLAVIITFSLQHPHSYIAVALKIYGLIFAILGAGFLTVAISLEAVSRFCDFIDTQVSELLALRAYRRWKTERSGL